MDLSQIEMWTRMALEAEARRRGIRNPELRGRTDLVRQILRHQYGERVTRAGKRVADGLQTLQQARALLGVALDAAAENLDAAAGSMPQSLGNMVRLGVQLSLPLRKTSAGSIDAPDEPRPDDSATRSTGTHTGTTSTGTGSGMASTGAGTGTGAPLGPTVGDGKASGQTDRGSAPATAHSGPEEAGEGHPEQPEGGAPGGQQASNRQPTRALDGRAQQATTRHFEQEPIRTHSMARVLARQGHPERALAIYEELLARHTDEPTLLEEAEILRAGGGPSDIPSDLPDPPGDPLAPTTDDQIACEGSATDGMGVRWVVTPEGTARAGAVLGRPGELAVRLVTISPDAERVVRSVITEYGPVAATGSWRAAPQTNHSRCFVAIGLRAEDRFVSIAHTRGDM